LVTISAVMPHYYVYIDHKDYELGEANDLIEVPVAQFTPDGLQARRWVCPDNSDCVDGHYDGPLSSSRFKLEEVRSYVQTAHRFRIPVTFNLDVNRNGESLPEALQLLRRLKAQVV